MGLAVRIIPTLLFRGDQLVKGRCFNAWRSVGHIEQAARICSQRAVDEIVLLDIDATPHGRGPDFERIERVAENFHTPLTVGGGVRSVLDARKLLRSGADKFAIGTAVCEVPKLVSQCADSFGSQAVVVSIDVGFGNTVMIGCGKSPWCSSPVDYALWAQDAGAGEILLTSIDREGEMQGYDLPLIESVSRVLDIPVIAHGGCSGPNNMMQAVRAGASAVAAGALFQFTEWTPASCARWLAEHGIETRVPA